MKEDNINIMFWCIPSKRAYLTCQHITSFVSQGKNNWCFGVSEVQHHSWVNLMFELDSKFERERDSDIVKVIDNWGETLK
jgi:hypothetical protein